MSRHIRATSARDHNVLTIFLPILAVALVACAAACFYRERRRKRRLKKGVCKTESDHISDTESIVSFASSSRHRPYLLPTPTTGRVFRSSSRTGSVRGAYDLESSYGEPPPYSGRSSRRSSIASSKALKEGSYQRKGTLNGAYASSQSSLSRSRSMLDMRDQMGQTPMRRTRSSTTLNSRYSDNNYPDMMSSRYGDETTSQRSGRASPVTSEWSIRTAPQMPTYDQDYTSGRPSSVASLPVRGRRSNMRRSLSQPNLSKSLTKTGTYPQGILKRQNNQGAFSDTGIKDYYGERDSGVGGSPNQMDDSSRPSTRPPSAYGSSRGHYDGYYADGANSYPTYPGSHQHQQRGYEDSIYSISSGHPYHQYGMNGRDSWNNQQYPSSYDPYSYGHSYWEQQSNAAVMQSQPNHDPYAYGSMIY